MSYKWFGAILVISGCGGFGFLIASNQRREEKILRQLAASLDYMGCELQYRLTPLPDLCRLTGSEVKGCIGRVFTLLAEELESQVLPDVSTCMYIVLEKIQDVPYDTREVLRLLGTSLGRFDLEGQLKGLESVRTVCRQKIEALAANREPRLRSYQTLGLCAGAALAILFM